MTAPDDDPLPPTIEWCGDHIRLLDQRHLPGALNFLSVRTVEDLAAAIEDLAVRGAPALGVAGAMGVALAYTLGSDLETAAARLIATRPTAVNLAWGVRRAQAAADPVAEALSIRDEDVAACRAIGIHGATLVPSGARILTHCNAGALACVRYGTALSVIRHAHAGGNPVSVWVDETRPVLQGARLTAWELRVLDIPARLIVDGAAAAVMGAGEVDLVVVGADRITANGDVVNKVGTYGLAVLARHHRIPFYVAAPFSTVDPATADGGAVVIEHRPVEELTTIGSTRIAPEGVVVENRAFDVTPQALVTAYVTEGGVFEAPAELIAGAAARNRSLD